MNSHSVEGTCNTQLAQSVMGRQTFPAFSKVAKWISIPILLLAATFSAVVGHYEPLINFVFCLGAMVVFQRAAWIKEYFWCAGLVAIVILFSPLLLVTKLFLLMIPTSAAAFLTVKAAFRRRPAALRLL